MAGVSVSKALLRAGASQTQVEDATEDLQMQPLVPAPAPDPQKWLSTALWQLPYASALSQEQLKKMKRVCSLSESDFDSLCDIVKRGSRFPGCLFGAMIACLFVLLLSMIVFFLSGRAFEKNPDPPPYYIVGQESLLVCFCLAAVYMCALPRANRQITRDLNQHFRGHASSLSFHLVVTQRTLHCLETAWGLVVGYETSADGSA
ncbi:unnamed protein product [Symbiodinium microadriaticum]|nr:unnamed protein product [Symbiodinium sp. KB8]CAE7456424.1 unnamed protein product [Symbiodinium microadriaticum]